MHYCGSVAQILGRTQLVALVIYCTFSRSFWKRFQAYTADADGFRGTLIMNPFENGGTER